jgi:hypothetical protein
MKFKLPELPKIVSIETKKSEENKTFKDQSPEEIYGNVKPLIKWTASSRAPVNFKESRSSRAFVIAGIVIGAFLIAMQEYFLVLMAASIVFFYYSVSKAKPEQVTYEINSHGFMYDDKQYYWHQLRYFFFIDQGGVEMLCIDTTLGFPARIFVNPGEEKESIVKELSQHIKFLKEAPKDKLAEVYDKVLDKFNLD